ncbi:diacylglycerol kinase, catalytic region [Alkaliphilus metalliredigens QYMF]|uniref:Diacylglycerol kinase, catalytic region n=1 Tax=Alkaliphilus metalliredigens (strain QYMF) TaxID=293826 RepID=A6TSX5_ALKMQ|nr:YegS/Rv2252/BmrU family lipid kinase [Alkaliphilus metalliredigens]ABR49293.1 diacylglycerol kinase, catalytic region [Alkaliphilus metalliredigens QYMF]
MKKIKIIYNPKAGRQMVQKNIPRLVEVLVKQYHEEVDSVATQGPGHAEELAYQSCQEGWDLIVAVGGDGTVNEVVNGMMSCEKQCPLAIYPAGTVNDFGSHLQISKKPEDFARMIVAGHRLNVDVGKAGERYFINVIAGGLLPNVAHNVSTEAKTVFGKLAYYMEGIKEFPKQLFETLDIQFQIGEEIYEKEVLFFFMTNSPNVGGFKHVAHNARLNDGKFDLLIVERGQVLDVTKLFFNAITGRPKEQPILKYIQVEKIRIHSKEPLHIDIDGEEGELLPMTFKVNKEALTILVPEGVHY